MEATLCHWSIHLLQYASISKKTPEHDAAAASYRDSVLEIFKYVIIVDRQRNHCLIWPGNISHKHFTLNFYFSGISFEAGAFFLVSILKFCGNIKLTVDTDAGVPAVSK